MEWGDQNIDRDEEGRELITIPKYLYDSDTNLPVSFCKICNKPLLESKSDYIIQKTIRNYPDNKLKEIIFEFAICFECNERMRLDLSQESQDRINEYLYQNIDFNKRMELGMYSPESNIDEWTNTCIITGKPVKSTPEYTILAHCRADKLVVSMLPYVISFEAMNAMEDLLSEKTRE